MQHTRVERPAPRSAVDTIDETHPDVLAVLEVADGLVRKRDIAAVVAEIRKGTTAMHLIGLYSLAKTEAWWLGDGNDGSPRLSLANVLGWAKPRARLEEAIAAKHRPAARPWTVYKTLEQQIREEDLHRTREAAK